MAQVCGWPSRPALNVAQHGRRDVEMEKYRATLLGQLQLPDQYVEKGGLLICHPGARFGIRERHRSAHPGDFKQCRDCEGVLCGRCFPFECNFEDVALWLRRQGKAFDAAGKALDLWRAMEICVEAVW